MTTMYRWFDHKGNEVEAPATEGRPTAYRWDDQYTHWMFGKPSSVATFQALTLCGKRALEIPGRGEVDCPECIDVLGDADARDAAQREETVTEDCHRCRHWTPAQRKWHHCIHCDGTGQVPAQQEENTQQEWAP